MANSRTGQQYEIRLRGVLGESVLSAFPTLRAHGGDGITVLSGPIADQAALYGVLAQVETLGLELLGLSRVDCSAERSAASRAHHGR